MVIDLVIKIETDGYNAVVPSLKGCESWAHTEDEAIEQAVELTRFYANIPDENEIKVDLARKNKKQKIYKLVFEKS